MDGLMTQCPKCGSNKIWVDPESLNIWDVWGCFDCGWTESKEYEEIEGDKGTLDDPKRWQPISPGDKSFEYPCPTCDADIHEFCTSKDQYGINRQHHTEVHWSRCEVADGR